MNRKNKVLIVLIISVFIIAGIVLGVNFVSNAAALNNAFGKEIVNINNNVGAIVAEFKHSTSKSATEVLDDLNSMLEKENIKASSGRVIEDEIIDKFYTIPGIICVKHRQSLGSYKGTNNSQYVNSTHGGNYSMYYRVNFDEETPYRTDPELKNDPTAFLTVYEAANDHSCGKSDCDHSEQTVYSNFNAINIYSGPLDDLHTQANTYNNNHRIPYIISFQKNTASLQTNPSEAQKALWGLTGGWSHSCTNGCGQDCYTFQEMELHKAGIAVEWFINNEKSHGANPTVSIPAGAEAGSAYYKRVGQSDLADKEEEMAENGELDYNAPQGQEISVSGIVRIGPFVMSDYAYAFSKDVAKYSNKDLTEWKHVLAGIVEGYVTISGVGRVDIVDREEGSQDAGASIVYKDWYNQVPYKYNSAADVRGDANRGHKTRLNGSEHEILYKPVIDDTEGAGVYSAQLTAKGSKELLAGGVITSNPLKVKVQDDSGNYTVNYPYPLPNSVFYIEIPVSQCGSPESRLESITFTYRTTETSGNGDVIITRAAESKTNFEKDTTYSGDGVTPVTSACSSYSCTDHNPSYASHDTSSTGGYKTCVYNWTCNSSGAPTVSSHDCTGHNRNDACDCKHSCNNDCASRSSCPGGTNHVCDSGCVTEYCGHNHTSACCDGKHDCGRYCNCPGHSGQHTSWFLCKHEHSVCKDGSWHTDTTLRTVYGQPLLVVGEAKTQVKETKVSSGLGVPILMTIDTAFDPVFVWHGWDSGFSTEGSINIFTDKTGYFDFSELKFTELDDVTSLVEIGDRITYRATIKNPTSKDLFVWLRIVYARNLVDDEVTNMTIKTNAVGDFFEGLFGANGKFVGQVTPKNMVVDGWAKTRNARLLIEAGGEYSFFYTYTFTRDVTTTKEDDVIKASTPYIQITSKDPKYKNSIKTNINNVGTNIDFTRKNMPGTPQHEGPVIMNINQLTTISAVKEYVINVNKYIYNVDHINSNNRTDTSAQTTVDRGYKFANGTTNLYTLDELKVKNEETEKNKKANPVYVEYGDRITYRIEIGNGKISNRTSEKKYDADLIYATLVDELPAKYSGLKVTILNAGLQGAHLKGPTATATQSDNGGKITITDLMIPKNGVTTVEVSFVIEEHERYDGSAAKLHENKAYIKDSIVYNYNRGPGANPGDGTPLEGLPISQILDVCDVSHLTNIIGSSSDWYVINDYQVDIDKYISSYKSNIHDANQRAGLTSETPKIENKGLDAADLNGLDAGTQAGNEDLDRVDWSDSKKKNDPVQVERTDEIIYSIKLDNKAVTTHAGVYPSAQNSATQVRVSKIIEEIDPSLEIVGVRAFIYKKGGARDREVTITKNPNSWGATKYEFTLDHSTKTILDPGEFLVVYVKAIVNESNMSLRKLENTATIAVLTNINTPASTNAASDPKLARIVKEEADGGYNENTEPQEKSTEYVRTKDLVVSGKVWLDKDRDGKMEHEDLSLLTPEEKARFNITGGMAGKPGVEVRLYKKGTTTPLRVTYTDGNGEYTFSKKSNGGWYTNSFESSGNTSVSKDGKTYQRVDKAEKDAYGNYLNQYIDYYIEFVYDGVLYKSTELYSRDNYSELSRADEGKTHLAAGNGNYDPNYLYDSNAAEIDDVRSTFNTKYEYISYNSALTGPNGTQHPGGDLSFVRQEHQSKLAENVKRAMTSRTFINDSTNVDNYLWLYKGDGVNGPNTEYLKYINFGLELREEVDISLTKDVYKVKTTVNGETMEYDFNQNNALNGASTGLGGSQRATNPYLQDFIIKKPYGLELYEFDYKFRVDQYFAEEVRNYKGSASELNVEVTYRITIDNKPISDADDVLAAGKTVTKTPLFVRVNEIMDLYEVNFIELGEKLNDEIKVKIKQEDGTLRDEIIKTVEAWYFVEDTNGTYIVENDKAVQNGAKPIYKEVNPADVPAATTKYARKDLTIAANSISADSKFTDNQIDYKDYGYNKLFIRGMDDIAIGEDKSLDVYVKYILDKGEEQFELNQESINAYEETSKEATVEYNSAVLGDAYGSYTHTIERQGRTNLFTIQRTLKIKDPTLLDGMTMERTNNRGLEGIAQINAYSVWYSEDLTRPASLVDRNSNVGNVGTDGSSPDDYTKYDDTTYKTGIVISVEQTATDKNNGSELSQFGALEVIGTPKLQRVINGTVWDDARSLEINEEYSSAPGAPKQLINKQYVGNGIYSADTSDLNNRKQSGAIANENVAENYKRDNGDAVTENHDFPIRNVKAEFIEIVAKEDPSSPTGYRYYEQHLQQVTWPYQQWDRTDDEGYYELKGFVPGTYIIRFTYGDNVNTDGTFDHTSPEQKDMLIFNGHDYKSAQFNKDLETIHGKDADKIMEILEAQGVSDALDDEIRRLEVNSYSEVMTNPKAEILKGTANGVLTTREEVSTGDELKALIENTTMQAETVEFLVKAEKLTTDQINKRKMTNTVLNPKYELYSQLKSVQELERNERKFTIAQIDFGLEYRPEAEIRLVKEIEEVKVITEDKNVLVDLFFYTENKGTDTVHKIDKNKSKGLELVQFVSNEYHVLLKDLTNEDKQGFVFVQVDEEILQGSTIDITYKFEAENNSEIDRIAVDLERIRYKENEEAKTLLGTYDTANELAKANYTASGIAAKVIKEDFYKEDTQGVEYRTRQKTLVNKNDANMPFDAKLAKEKLDSYYGRFVGYAYYTGDVTKLDTVASLKFDKILDFVDVNIEYIQQSEQASTADKFWIRTKSTDLKDYIYQLRIGKVNALENGRGYSYDENLVVSVDDRIKDDKYSTRYSTYKVDEEVDSNIRNNDLSRFLLPQSTVLDETERDKSVGTVRLNVSKVLSAEADKKDMSYENLAEVIQFTTLTGRRTDFGTTIGNSDVMATALSGGDEGKGSLEFVTASFESDTAATETITLIPPTGLMRNRRAIVNVVEATTVGVGIVFVLGTIAVILIMIITMVLFVIRKYKKRRIV